MKLEKLRVLFFISILIFFISCGGNHLELLKNKVSQKSEEINNAFKKAKSLALENKKILDSAFTNMDKYDLDIEKMDVKNGGLFEWFNDYVYYQTKDDGKGAAFYYLFDENVGNDEKIKASCKKILLLKTIADELIEGDKDYKYGEALHVFTSDFIQSTYPYWEVLSTIAPKGLPSNIAYAFPFFAIAAPEQNPEKKAMWPEDAFVGMAGEGWLCSISVPIYSNNGTKFEGVTAKDVEIFKIRNIIVNEDDILLFLGSGTSILGLTDNAKTALDLKDLADFDYVEKMNKNEFVAEEYILTSEEQTPEIRELGNKIKAGEEEFTVNIKGTQYTAVVSKIDEVGFFLVGLDRKSVV